MNIIEIEDFMTENQLSQVYIQSPRWNDEKIVSLSKIRAEYAPYISIDSSTDEGIIGNIFDMGRFLNSTEAAIYDDFEIVPHKEGLEKFKKYREIFEEKYSWGKHGIN